MLATIVVDACIRYYASMCVKTVNMLAYAIAKRAQILGLLVEGTSLRATPSRRIDQYGNEAPSRYRHGLRSVPGQRAAQPAVQTRPGR
jgi:hypothetical protein